MNTAIFRAYDVRGVADQDLTDDVARDLGRAFGSEIRMDGGRRVSLGRDCRTHGARLRAAFLEGLLSTGVDVLDVGVVASPLLYFSVFHHDLDGGVQITGSHNPPDYNGFKMMSGKRSLHGERIQALRRRIEDRDFVQGSGSLSEDPVHPAYVDHVARSLSLGDRRLKVVVDGGNGTGGPPAVDL
ncbi:MAG: phosphomannomutase, partial [Myxococcota bacterium]|nr:phosphomannomutase [Myxococcota bacterium]